MPKNYLSVSDHFWGLALKGLSYLTLKELAEKYIKTNFFPPDTYMHTCTYVCVLGGKKCCFFWENFAYVLNG